MMSIDAPPQVAALADGDERYQVRSALEIGRILRGLVTSRAMITAHAGDHGAFFVTAILEVDNDGTLVCDYGVDAASTERMLRAPMLTFVTQLDHVRVQFSVCGAVAEHYEGGPAFRVACPDVVTRLQRREHYRLRVPRGRPLYCQLTPPCEEPQAATLARISVPIYDISCGGIGLTGWPATLAPRTALELTDAWIELPDLGRLVVDLRVIYVHLRDGRGTHAGRFGCRFARMNPSASMQLQRYINRIEREQRALQ